MVTVEEVKTIIEALLVVSEGGLTRETLIKAIPEADKKDVEAALEMLKADYDSPERGFNIAEIAGKCRIVTKPKYMPWISNLYQKEPDRLKGASLETLAIIAYKQPTTRGEIEAVRGVNVGGVLRTLLDKGLLEVRGRKDVVGKPLLYGTTEKFLELFGLNSLSDLPTLREFTEEDLEYGKPSEGVPMEEEEPQGNATIEEENQAEEGKEPEDVGVEPEEIKGEEVEASENVDESSQEPEISETITEEPEYESEKSE